MVYTKEELLYIIPFYILGALLGYFAFEYKLYENKMDIVKKCILTTCMGTFLAYIFSSILLDYEKFSKHTCMVLGGLGSFGFPDLVLNYWKKLVHIGFRFILHKIDSHLGGKR